jgi:sporulation protein YlmC with PRC-barrel domain
MNTSLNMKLRKWIILIIPLLAVGFILAACDGGDEEGGGGGLADETPMVETPDIGATDVMTEEVPLETATTEMTSTVEMTATAEMTATEEITSEVTVEATEVITEDGTADTMAPDAVMLASDFIDMEIHDPAGEELGSVWEILADEEGTIQYVLVNVGVFPPDADDGYPSDAVTGTTEITGTAPFGLVALTWDGFEVELDNETEETDDIVIVYSGETEALNTSTLEADFIDFLDQDGYVLEDDPDNEFALPPEFVGLIQVSDYDDYELQDTAGNDLGDTEDLLVDMSTGEILYAITDVGGFLGIGANSIAIPWDAMNLEVIGDEDERTQIFTLDVTEDFLAEAPALELGDWNPLVEEGWDDEVSSYWESMMTTS